MLSFGPNTKIILFNLASEKSRCIIKEFCRQFGIELEYFPDYSSERNRATLITTQGSQTHAIVVLIAYNLPNIPEMRLTLTEICL